MIIPADRSCRRYSGRTALVTGAGSGIGAATAVRLGAESAQVWVNDIDPAAAEATVETIRTAGGTAAPLLFDAADEKAWAAVGPELPELDVAVLNVGRNEASKLTDLSAEGWHAQLRISLDTVFHGARTVLPRVRPVAGSLVLVSSVHALVGFPGFPAYAAAKGAIGALTRQLAVDYGPDVRVNAVVPGAIETPLWARRDQAFRDRVTRLAPLRRLGRPEEVAAGIAFLGSADAAFVTGHQLVVDGGRTASAQEWLTDPGVTVTEESPGH